MKKFFTPLAMMLLFFAVAFNANAQLDPPYGTCDSASGPYEPPASATTDADGNFIVYNDGSNWTLYMQTPEGGTQPDNAFVFNAIDYEGGVPVDTFLVISDDYTVDLTALGLDEGDVLQAFSFTYDIATINTIAEVVTAQCSIIETLTGNDQVCEILDEIAANGGFQSLEDAITLAGLFFGEIPSVGEAVFQLDTLNQILINFGPILGISDQICFGYDGFTTINVVAPPPTPDNDDCVDAIELGLPAAFGEIAHNGPYTNVDATLGPEDPTEEEVNAFQGDPCMFEDQFGAVPFVNGTVWFTLTGDGNEYHVYTSADGGETQLTDTYVDDGDTQIIVFTGGCDGLEFHSCNEDDALATGGDFFAGLDIATEEGVVYYILVDGFNLDTGVSDGEFFVNVEAAVDPCVEAFIESAADTPAELSLCPNDTLTTLSVNAETLNFGTVSDGLEGGIFWVVSLADPAGANPLDFLGTDDYVGIFYVGTTITLGQLDEADEYWVSPVMLQTDPENGDLFFPVCDGWGLSTFVTELAEDDEDCIDCDPVAATLSTEDPTTLCLSDGDAIVNVNVDGAGEQEVTYVITDESGETILGVSSSPAINFGPSESTVLDFETPETTSMFQAFGGAIEGLMYGPVANPNPSGINMSDNVIEFNKAVGSESWSGGFANPNPTTAVDLTSGGEVCIKVHMDAPRTVTIKLENSATNPDTWEQTVLNETLNEWVEICFDSNAASTDGNGNVAAGHSFPTVVVFFNLLVDVGDVDEITYFDDIVVKNPGAPPGVCLIWAVTHDGTLSAPTDQVADLEGCFAISNSIAVTRTEAFSATISTEDSTDLCTSDDSSVVNVTVEGAGDQQMAYVVTDESGSVVLGQPENGAVDFAGAPSGVCLIWVVTHDGSFNAPTDQVADFEGCFALSNAIAVTRTNVEPALILLLDGLTETSVCVNDEEQSSVIFNVEGEGDNQVTFVVTDEAGETILGLPESNFVDFAGVETGTCLIWAVTHDGSLNAPTDQVADLEGCFALSNPIVVDRQECFDCDAQAGAKSLLNDSYADDANVVANCEDVVINSEGFNSLSDYSFAIVATQGDDLTVAAMAGADADGNTVFAGLEAGTYCFHSLSYANDNAPTLPEIGESAAVLFDDASACFQLNNAENDATACIEVVVLSPITIEGDRVCPADDPTLTDGTYRFDFTVSGGLPEYDEDAEYFLAGDVNGSFTAEDAMNLSVLHADGEQVFQNANDDTSCPTIEFNVDFETECVKLSIELSSFAGKATERGNEITWTTASEYENDYFTLQSSKDGFNFVTIATVNGAGNSIYTNSYSYIDVSATAGLTYYRLLDTDFNGVTSDNGIIEVARDANEFVINSITPVPANDFVNINFDSVVEAEAAYEIYDLTGKLIKRGVIQTVEGNNVVELNVADMSTGVYLLSMTLNSEATTAKLIKK